MNAQYDVPMYPQLGHVYPGDYYEALPFDDYIDRAQPLPSGENVFDIRDFGAVPEKERLNTEAFRAAARACEQAGGGTILVAGGSYWMGAVHVPSNTTLFIAADSEIVASRNMAHMGEAVDLGGQPAYAFVHIANAENVVVTGGGRISGNGEWYVYEPREKPSLTPFPITALPRTDPDFNDAPDDDFPADSPDNFDDFDRSFTDARDDFADFDNSRDDFADFCGDSPFPDDF